MENIISAQSSPQLIVMLTHHDFTVENAEEIFELSKYAPAAIWGMKEKPLSLDRMKSLFARMKECGKTTVLEVVGYSEEEAGKGAEIAAECGCDILMGTKFFPSVAKICHKHGILYFPFVGTIEGRPSVLTGSIEEIVAEARDVISKGADGIDLLGYRYVDDPLLLNKTLVQEIDAPVCLAGSIDSFNRLDEVKETSPRAFTIGSAFFDNRFEGSFPEQIAKVDRHLNNP